MGAVDNLIRRKGAEYTIQRFAASSKLKGRGVQGAEIFLLTKSNIQSLTFGLIVSSLEGNFQLTFDGQVADFSGGADAAIIQAALEALSNIGSGNILVTTTDNIAFTLTFRNALANLIQPLFEVTGNTLANINTHLGPVSLDVALVQQAVEENTRQTILASVQTASSYEMNILPEGQRTRQGLTIYTTFHLKPASEQTQVKGDRLMAYDRVYEVQKVDPYPAETALPHYRALATLVEQD